MGIISTLFTGVGAVIIGIFLGFVVALIIGAIDKRKLLTNFK